MTRTRTVLFHEDSLEPLRRASAELRIDFEQRKLFMEPLAREKCLRRLVVLEGVIDLLGEWAD